MLTAFLIIFCTVIPTRLYVNSLLPDYSGEFSLPSISQNITVYRDKYNIPHIYAQNETDAQIALGYVMASERLFQMEMARRIGAGRLSELFGEKTLNLDILLRKLQIKKTADLYLKKHRLSPEVQTNIDAYLKGVNYFIETATLPIEFKILGIKPEKFEPAHMLAVSGYLALSFAEGIIGDTLFSDLFASFPANMVEELRPRHRMGKISGTPKFTLKNKQWYKNILSALDTLEDQFGLFHGSNSWVIGKNRSKSGAAILANDPHIAFSSPSVWFEAHIHTPKFEIYGHYIPLVPFPLLGHSRDGGWALTMSEADDLDIYLEKINPNNPNQVMYKNRWVNMEVYDEFIKVKGQKDKKITIKVTPHGPLLDDTEFGVKKESVAIKWAYHHPDNHVIRAFYELSRAKTSDDYINAISHATAPGLNISWVDQKGEIGWHVMGKIPNRKKGTDASMMLEGHSGKDEYLGYLPFSENPHLYKPKSGLIVSANFKPQSNSMSGKYNIQGYWQPKARYYQIHKLLAKQQKWSSEELKKIQTNQVPSAAKILLPPMLQSVVVKENEQEQKALHYLQQWDGSSDTTSIASAIYHKWVYYLGREILDDQLGDTRYKAYARIVDIYFFYEEILKNPHSKWWDNIKTKEVETSQQIITKAWQRTISSLTNKLGSDVDFWQWGEIHTVEYQHFFGRKKPLNYFFNVGPFPAGGGNGQIDNMGHPHYFEDFTVTRGPSTRRLIDFKDPSTSWGILPTGNSGNPQSPYYEDQAEMFLQGKYRKQLMNKSDIMKESIGKIIFTK